MSRTEFIELYTTFHGRIGRAQWWFGFLVLFVFYALVLTVLHFGLKDLFEGTRFASPRPNPMESLASLLLVIPQVALVKKRFNDRAHAPWVTELYAATCLALVVVADAGFVPGMPNSGVFMTVFWLFMLVYGTWVLIDNGFRIGTKGPNNYGPDPLDT